MNVIFPNLITRIQLVSWLVPMDTSYNLRWRTGWLRPRGCSESWKN